MAQYLPDPPSRDGGSKAAKSASESQDLTGVEDQEEGHRGGGMLFLLFGCILALLGMALIALQQTGCAEKIERLSAMGFPPGTFVTAGILLAALSFVLRELTSTGQSFHELEEGVSKQVRRIQRSLSDSAFDPELLASTKRIETRVAEVQETQLSNAEEASRNVGFIRDAEIKIDSIKRMLEETHRRILEVHQQISETLPEVSPSELAPSITGNIEKVLEEKLALREESEAETQEAIAATNARIERIQSLVTENREQIQDSWKQIREQVQDSWKQMREQIQDSWKHMRDEMGLMSSKFESQAVELSENLQRIVESRDSDAGGSDKETQEALATAQASIENIRSLFTENRGQVQESWKELREEMGAMATRLEAQNEELGKLQGLIKSTPRSKAGGGGNEAALSGIQNELSLVMQRFDQLQALIKSMPRSDSGQGAAAAGVAGESTPGTPAPGAAGVNNAIEKLRRMQS